MEQVSIFSILQDEGVQQQWKRICELHDITKEYLLIAEEVCEDGVLFFQPLKEHRDAYDHVIRTFSIDLKRVPPSVDCVEYVKKNLEKAYSHEYRAFFDTADWLSYTLRKSIRLNVKKMRKNEKIAFDREYTYDNKSAFELLNEYPFNIALLRKGKDIANTDTLISEIDEYKKILDRLIKMYKGLST